MYSISPLQGKAVGKIGRPRVSDPESFDSSVSASQFINIPILQNAVRKHFGRPVDVNTVVDKILSLNFASKGLKSLIENPHDVERSAASSQPLVYLSHCKNLRTLYLEYNQIRSVSGISRLSMITCLHLAENNLEDIGEIGELTSLKKLFLQKNKLSMIDHLDKCLDIEELDLANQRSERRLLFAESTMHALSASLESLNLAFNHLSSLSELVHDENGQPNKELGSLALLRKLRRLDLGGNDISSLQEVAAVCRGCPQLIWLNLSGNPVSREKRYRELVILLCPLLKTLDEKPLLEHERAFYTAHRKHKQALESHQHGWPRRLSSGGGGGPAPPNRQQPEIYVRSPGSAQENEVARSPPRFGASAARSGGSGGGESTSISRNGERVGIEQGVVRGTKVMSPASHLASPQAQAGGDKDRYPSNRYHTPMSGGGLGQKTPPTTLRMAGSEGEPSSHYSAGFKPGRHLHRVVRATASGSDGYHESEASRSPSSGVMKPDSSSWLQGTESPLLISSATSSPAAASASGTRSPGVTTSPMRADDTEPVADSLLRAASVSDHSQESSPVKMDVAGTVPGAFSSSPLASSGGSKLSSNPFNQIRRASGQRGERGAGGGGGGGSVLFAEESAAFRKTTATSPSDPVVLHGRSRSSKIVSNRPPIRF